MLIDIRKYESTDDSLPTNNSLPDFIETTNIRRIYIEDYEVDRYRIVLMYKSLSRSNAATYVNCSSRDNAIVILDSLVARINTLNDSGQEPRPQSVKNRFQEILNE